MNFEVGKFVKKKKKKYQLVFELGSILRLSTSSWANYNVLTNVSKKTVKS